MFKKFLSLTTILSIMFSTSVKIIEASGYIPRGHYNFEGLGKISMPTLSYRNAYTGEYWLNEHESGDSSSGIQQGKYIDHIDVRIDDAIITMNFYENGEFKYSKPATLISVTDVLVNGSSYPYVKRGELRDDGKVGKAEYNFQIVNHPDKNGNGKIERDEENYDFNYWLDLETVKEITIVSVLRVYNDDQTYTDYEGMTINYTGLENIVENSHCTNASGLDYHLIGNVSHNVNIELPPPPDPPTLPELEPLNVDLVPSVGDQTVLPNIASILGTSFILLNKNKKFKK